jgi:hypothetical protein
MSKRITNSENERILKPNLLQVLRSYIPVCDIRLAEEFYWAVIFMQWPIGFHSVGAWISTGLPSTHTYTADPLRTVPTCAKFDVHRIFRKITTAYSRACWYRTNKNWEMVRMIRRSVGLQSNEQTYKNICQNCQHPRPDSNCLVVNRNQAQLSTPIRITGLELNL